MTRQALQLRPKFKKNPIFGDNIFSRMYILLNFDPNLRQQGKCDAFFRREKHPLHEFG